MGGSGDRCVQCLAFIISRFYDAFLITKKYIYIFNVKTSVPHLWP